MSTSRHHSISTQINQLNQLNQLNQAYFRQHATSGFNKSRLLLQVIFGMTASTFLSTILTFAHGLIPLGTVLTHVGVGVGITAGGIGAVIAGGAIVFLMPMVLYVIAASAIAFQVDKEQQKNIE